MNLALRIDNNIVSIIVSIVFLINISSHLDKKEIKNKIFVALFTLNTFQLIVETLTCITNRLPFKWLVSIDTLLHVFLFILGPAITYLWYVFADLWIKKGTEYTPLKNTYVLLPLIFNTLLVLLSPAFNLVFYITENNVYTRGPLFFIPFAIAYFYLLSGFIMIYISRKNLNRLEFLPLLLFGVLPALGGLIQLVFYGLLLLWSSVTFSLILLYFYLQQQMLHVDYLTGAWTREKLYSCLNDRINQARKRNFSIVFIDLDNFKDINDNFGHNEGDTALINVVRIFKSKLRKDDSVTRYGGDEFVLFLNVDSPQEVESIMMRIDSAFDEYNKSSNLPYELNFSFGYELYDFNSPMSVDEYIKHVDMLMYKEKHSKRGKR
jgi:diguanylate cyclase (GGDEF)-like protein